MTLSTIGIDVSKDHLDAHRLPDGAHRRFTNSGRGLKALRTWLTKTPAQRIVYEPTGINRRYFMAHIEQLLERTLAPLGLPLVKINPRQVRRFAEATGKLAKTDRADAALLARMGAVLKPPLRPMADAPLAELKELHIARQALMKDRTAARNRQKTLTLPLVKRQNVARLEQIETHLNALDEDIRARIHQNAELAQRCDILCSIPGISEITAWALLIEMPELGSLDRKQAASLAGLAPVARQSGNRTGRAFIRGGRANLRQALYMPALVAMRFNEDLKAKYLALSKAGKPAKVAITAIMRKLLVLANALLRDKRKWTTKPA